jgi:two-component system chemotaxis response regulator CheY
MKAIIVDDSRAIRMVLKKLLTGIGFECIEAGHGKEALERLAASGALDLALVDWNMPEMNGLEFVTALRKLSDFDSMRVMMVTTETETEQIMRALDAGANEYMMKPFSSEALQEKLVILGLLEAAARA